MAHLSRRFDLVLLTTILGIAHISTSASEKPETRHVVLVSIDGFAASYLSDPKANIPNLRRLAALGAHAKGMITSFPSVTWPAHTSAITGARPAKHGVIGNAVWNRKRNQQVTYIGDPVLTKQQAIKVPTLYDVVHAGGFSTASVIWPCSNGATSLDWVIPDSNKAALHEKFTTKGFVAELAHKGIDISQLGQWGWNKKYSTERDFAYTRVAQHLLTKHKINLILLHLITPDGVEHTYGPHTPEAYAAVAESDQRIAELWETLQSEPFRNRSTMFIISDHGFAQYDRLIRPNVLLREAGLIKTDTAGKVTQRDAWCIAQGGSAFIYILEKSRESALLTELEKRFTAIESIENVLTGDRIAELGLPRTQDNPEAPHLVLTTGPGFSFDNGLTGTIIAEAGGSKGTHGHDPRPEYMHATFIAAGAGIKNGVVLDRIENIDVAPTIAHLFGLPLPTADGRVLTEILSDKK